MNSVLQKVSDYYKYTDKFLWLLIIIINIYSLVIISSMQRAGDYNYLRTQAIALALGAVGSVCISCLDYKYIKKLWWLAAVGGIGLIALVFVFGTKVEGTDDTAWINVNGYSLQPSELVKMCFIVTMSFHLCYLSQNNKLRSFPHVLLLGLHGVFPVLLIHMQGDDGSALIFALIFIIMTFAAGIQFRYYTAAFFAVLLAAPFVWTSILNDDQRNRFLVLFNKDSGDAMYGWQQYQAKLSISSGGYLGEGLYKGQRVEMAIVPEQENDFIFTVIGEELGFIGCCIVLLLFILMLFRIFYKSAAARDEFGQYLCIGVFAMLFSQISINLGMVLGFLPVVGVTLPFFSAGGTSLLALMLCVGMVQSVNYYSDDERLIVKSHK
ncbi:MAG: rod shape-determining protein RodA [Clostridia bacterium]|nr:rod shape-determining protein RodA [Clostridia bacterium]